MCSSFAYVIDHPGSAELLEAMAETLTAEVMPACDGSARHAARVVANLCRILAREATLGSEAERQTGADLAALLGHDGEGDAPNDLAALVSLLDHSLSENNPSGTDNSELFAALLQNVKRRLDVSKPEYR